MKINIGSKVKFLNDVGGGVVKNINSQGLAEVETEDGFEIPVNITELILDEAGTPQQESTQAVINDSAKEPLPEPSFEDKKHAPLKGTLHLAIVPENENMLHISSLILYLINDSNYLLHYAVSYKEGQVWLFLSHGTIEQDTKLELTKYSQSDLSKIKEIRIQAIQFKHGLFDPVMPIDISYKTGEISFYKSSVYKENDYFHERAVLLQSNTEEEEKELLAKKLEELKESEMVGILRSKEEKKTSQHQSPKKQKKDYDEVDLHIEAIIDDHEKLDKGEIIKIQLDRFETALETALHSKAQKIVFIHGIGNGTLKYELRKKLDRKYIDLRYQDASFKEFGYGATMVYLN